MSSNAVMYNLLVRMIKKCIDHRQLCDNNTMCRQSNDDEIFYKNYRIETKGLCGNQNGYIPTDVENLFCSFTEQIYPGRIIYFKQSKMPICSIQLIINQDLVT
jgi:hypothetical protein